MGWVAIILPMAFLSFIALFTVPAALSWGSWRVVDRTERAPVWAWMILLPSGFVTALLWGNALAWWATAGITPSDLFEAWVKITR